MSPTHLAPAAVRRRSGSDWTETYPLLDLDMRGPLVSDADDDIIVPRVLQ
jgi:hypothetical protein